MENNEHVYEKIKNISDLMPCCVYWIDNNHFYLGSNNLFAQTLGLGSYLDLVGKNNRELFPEKTLDTSWNIIDKNNLETLNSNTIKIFEELITLPNGKEIFFLSQKIPLTNSSGETIGLLAVCTDITNLKKQEDHLKQTETTLEHIIAHMPGHVYWKNLDGIYLGCNNRQAKSLGLRDSSEVIGKTDFELPWSKGNAEKFRKNDLAVIQSGKVVTSEEQAIYDGQETHVLSQKVPLRDHTGNIIGILGISVDLTDRKALEKNLLESKERAEAADKAKTEFLMNMRHDIRTPLSGIIGFASLIKEEVKTGNVAEYADNMLASGQALLDFLNEILETIRVTSGEIPLVRKKFNLKEKITAVLTLNQSKAKQKQLQLSFNYDDRLPKYLLGDAKRIHRIVLELVSNALNFTDQGEVNIQVELAKQVDRDVIIKIIVSDTGIGIPADKLEDIFIRFKRLSPSYEGIYKGAGIGLTVVKQFVDDLEGEIYVDSEVNKGSTFTCVFRFKAALLDDEQGVDHSILLPPEHKPLSVVVPHPREAIHSPRINRQTGIHLLIVEDSPIAALVANKLLTDLGCVVDVAADGQSALKQVKTQKYDGIFMDVGLPDMSGNEVTRAFRTWEENLEEDRRTPIIALTAHVETEEKQSCIEAGMDAVLSKPLSREKAIDILTAFIPQYSSPLTTETSSTMKETLFTITGKVLDTEVGLQVVGNADLIKEMVALLQQQLPLESSHLQQAHAANDWLAIQSITHKLKGSSAYCGAVRLQQATGYLHDYIKAKKVELRDVLYQQVLDEITLLEKTFT